MLEFLIVEGYPVCERCGKDLRFRPYEIIDGNPVCFTCAFTLPEPEPKPVFCKKCIYREFVDDGMWEGDKCASKPIVYSTYLHVYFQKKDCQLKNSCNDCQEFVLKIKISRARRFGRWVSKLLRCEFYADR